MIDKRLPDRPGSSGDEGGIRPGRSARNLLARTTSAATVPKVTAEALASQTATKSRSPPLHDEHLSNTPHENRDAQRAHRLVQPKPVTLAVMPHAKGLPLTCEGWPRKVTDLAEAASETMDARRTPVPAVPRSVRTSLL